MFFAQMSGFPGSGKSTLAKEIAKRTGAIIVDHDISKSALLHSVGDGNIDPKLAGKISYNIDWSFIDFQLSLGNSVIFDSPCLYEEMVHKGTAFSNKYNAKYKYVECYVNDFHTINRRLRNRKRLISQIEEVKSEIIFKNTIENCAKPSGYDCLKVNTSKPIEDYIFEVIKYINT